MLNNNSRQRTLKLIKLMLEQEEKETEQTAEPAPEEVSDTEGLDLGGDSDQTDSPGASLEAPSSESTSGAPESTDASSEAPGESKNGSKEQGDEANKEEETKEETPHEKAVSDFKKLVDETENSYDLLKFLKIQVIELERKEFDKFASAIAKDEELTKKYEVGSAIQKFNLFMGAR